MTMPRVPAQHIDHNLIFNDGTTWALWRLTPPTYARMTHREKMVWHARVSAAITSIQTDAMILNVALPVEADEVAASMVAGVDLAAQPQWADVALRAHANIAAGGYHRRAQFIAVALPATTSLAGRIGAAQSAVAQRFGVAPGPPSRAVRDAVRRAAAAIEAPLRSLLGPSRVAPAMAEEAEWLYARAGLRGLRSVPLSEFTGRAGTGASTRLAAIGGGAVLFEGGTEDDQGRGTNRRYLRADTEGGSAFSAYAVFSHLPRQFFFPGGQGELLADLCVGDHIDWCVRITPTANATAKGAITAQVRKLATQFDEYAGDAAGAPGALGEAIEVMRAEIAELESSPSMPELHVSVIVSVSGASAGEVNDRMAAVRTGVRANDYDLPSPIGNQGDLWEAMLPGSATPGVCGHYRQFLLPKGMAGLAPFAGSDLGDNQGPVIALNLDAGERPVQFWIGTGPNLPDPVSGSVGVFGVLGAGKSHFTKTVIADTIGMGGQVLVTDRTAMGEYLPLVPVFEAEGHSCQVISLSGDAEVSLDPLAVFVSIDDQVRYGVGFLTLMAGLSPTGAEASVLETAIRRVAEDGGRMCDVVDALRSSADEDPVFREAAARVALQVAVFTRGALANLIFDPMLDPVEVADTDYIVFHAPHLDLPSREEMADRGSLIPEQVFSSALLYLVAAVAREVAFARRDRFSLIVQDEGYVLANPQGNKLLGNILRDGRKHNAALIFGSHHPSDLHKDLVSLLGSWFLFRMARDSAAGALAAMGLDVTAANIDLVAGDADRSAGRCLYRDLDGRVGYVKVLPGRTAGLRAAFDTGIAGLRSAPAGAPRRRRTAVGAA